MSRRFYSAEPITGDDARLEGAEAHHLAHVMRAKVGDEIVLFDGLGSEFDACICGLSRNLVELRVVARRDVSRELALRLEIAVALPRGDRQEWLTQKLVELGVARLIPWQTSRGVAMASDKTIQRLRRQVVEASKQCGRNRLMEITGPADFLSVIAESSIGSRLLAHPSTDGRALSGMDEASDLSADDAVLMGVGPEGGFTSQETEAAIRQGWQLVNLGSRILRTETAAVAMAAWSMLRWS